MSNIIWQGWTAKKSLLYCMQDFSFTFNEVIHLTIRDLEFQNCGYSAFSFKEIALNLGFIRDGNSWIRDIAFATILLENVSNVNVSNVTISRSKGYGLLAVNLLGESVIEASTFARNNLETVENKTMGGNALLIFLNDYYYSNTSLKINNSYFFNGSDNSKIDNCSVNRCYKDIDFRANGLSLVLTPQTSKLALFLENLIFSSNSQNMQHPAIRIFCKTLSRGITFTNCLFEYEGSFMIQQFSSTKYLPSPYIKIENCSFNGGANTAIDIFIVNENPTSTARSFSSIISIDSCKFASFAKQPHSVGAVLQVEQKGMYQSCLHTRVQVLSSVFQNNYIPSMRLLLDTMPEDDEKHACSSIMIVNSIYRNCSSPDTYIVYLGRVNYEENVHIWKHEKATAKGNKIDQVEFINSSFVSNRLTSHSYKGIVGLNKVYASFSDCLFSSSVGTAIQANESVISLNYKNIFINNAGKEGGALSLIKSRLHLCNNSKTIIENNSAEYGGGIFATPLQFLVKQGFFSTSTKSTGWLTLCTLSLPTYDIKNLNITFELKSNTAFYKGSSIFYGTYSQCCVSPNSGKYKYISQDFAFINTSLINLFTISSSISDLDVSSIATSLLACENNVSMRVNTYPGAEFNISVRTTGKYTTIPPVVVTGRLCYGYQKSFPNVCEHDYQSELHSGGGKQLATYECRNITFSIHGLQQVAHLEIRVDRLSEESPSILYYKKKDITLMAEVNVLACPVGYQMADKSNEKSYCECNSYLKKLGISCNIKQGGLMLRPRRMWIGFHRTRIFTIATHKHCPFDYCSPEDNFFSLSSPDKQCNNNHASTLCGACKKSLSLVLGTSNCKECSNIYLLLIVPFALAGIALVVLLLKCNLTVSVGHINGIIFYANVVHINKALLFRYDYTAYRVLTTFIAWLNLDLGIETCFFEGMDTYSKVWLQFVFPVYLWLMISIIVVMAHYSTRAARLIGSNSVPVLATLFVLSYAKLLRTIIAAVSFTFIEFEDDSNVLVWLHDANLEYLDHKHGILFSAAIIFMLAFIIPLTLLVLLSPCLQSLSHKKGFKWVNSLKPFLDANQGPFTDKFRWWSGLLLVYRIILYTIFASNYDNDPSMSFFWINVTIFPVSIFCLTKTVYKCKFANYLESLSLLNIVALCTVNWLTATTEYIKWQEIGDYASCISIVLAIISFMIIMLNQLSTKSGLKTLINRSIKSHWQPAKEESIFSQGTDQEMIVRAPTSSTVEIKQCDRLTESLLSTQN